MIFPNWTEVRFTKRELFVNDDERSEATRIVFWHPHGWRPKDRKRWRKFK